MMLRRLKTMILFSILSTTWDYPPKYAQMRNANCGGVRNLLRHQVFDDSIA